MTRIEFSVAACLWGAYALFLMALFWVLWSRASRRRKRVVNQQSQLPQIRDALVDYLAGSNDRARLREFLGTNRDELSDAIIEFHSTVGGSARDRLCDLALEFALVHEWCQETQSKDRSLRRRAYTKLSFVCAYEPCRRLAGDLLSRALEDSDPEVRLAAARALVQSGTIQELSLVFQLAVSQSLLIRLLLAEDLRRHAAELCAEAVPAVLSSGNLRQMVAALQIMVAWERALPLANLERLMESSNRDVRLEALHLAPLVPLTSETRNAVLQALRANDPEESTAAALAAGRLRIQEAMPALALCLRTGTAELARMAASAMSEMPPVGWQTLQQIAGGTGTSALIAAAAWERAQRRAAV